MSPAFTDLIEYPLIQFYSHRNQGEISDLNLSPSNLDKYMKYYLKDPRNLFLENLHPLTNGFNWTKEIPRGKFFHSIGTQKTPFKPILKTVFKHEKFDPTLCMVTHLYRHKTISNMEEKKTALVYIHGFAESKFTLHEPTYFRLFHRVFECEIYALELPYHLHRQPLDSPFSGSYFINGNPIRMLEAFRQSIQEIISLTRYLREDKGYKRVILLGTSLGGHLVAVCSQFLEGIDIVAALASPFLFRLGSRTSIAPIATKTATEVKKRDLAKYYKILYPCNLKYFSPFTTNENTVIIGGRFDRIVPFEWVQDLATMLEKPLLHYPGGHVTLAVWIYPLLRQVELVFS